MKETIAPKTCVGLLHKGPYHEIGSTFHKFFSQLNAHKANGSDADAAAPDSSGCGASNMDGKALGLYLDNPRNTKPEDLRSYAAMEVTPDATQKWPEEWKQIQVGGGPAAVMTVNGSYSQLGEAWQSFGQRVAEQGWKLSTKPDNISQEIYINMDDQDESKNVTKLIMLLEE